MYQYEPVPPPPAAGDSGATTSLIIGIIGLLTCGLFSPVALFLGISAKRRIRASGGRLGGDGKAVAGIVLGAFGTTLLAQVALALALFAVNGLPNRPG